MIDDRIVKLSDMLAIKSGKESECFPVDRYFLKPYIERIISLNRNDFLLYNLERVNNTYTVQLFLCLPELWVNIDFDDINEIIANLANVFSFFALINFTYRYVEVNIIGLIFRSSKVSSKFKTEIKNYLKTQYPNFFKSDSDYLFFEEGLYGVKIDAWKYIKQRLLLDKRIEPALGSIEELEAYVMNL